MQIVLFKNNDDKRKLTKTLNGGLTISGKLTDLTDFLNPVIELGYNADIINYNYVYIPAFKRYYFVDNFSVDNNVLTINLHCDVLMTYKNDILSSKALVTRTHVGNKYLPDAMITQTSKINRQVKQIGTGFSKKENYIVQIGG